MQHSACPGHSECAGWVPDFAFAWQMIRGLATPSVGLILIRVPMLWRAWLKPWFFSREKCTLGDASHAGTVAKAGMTRFNRHMTLKYHEAANQATDDTRTRSSIG